MLCINSVMLRAAWTAHRFSHLRIMTFIWIGINHAVERKASAAIPRSSKWKKSKMIITQTGGYPMGTRSLLTLTLLFTSHIGFASSTTSQGAIGIDSSIALLDNISYLPNPYFAWECNLRASLSPAKIRHKDLIGLTDKQLRKLEQWRKQNRQPMLAAMKEAALKRVEIKQAALTPTVSSARLQNLQNDIFRRQREILEYKLSCRDHLARISHQTA